MPSMPRWLLEQPDTLKPCGPRRPDRRLALHLVERSRDGNDSAIRLEIACLCSRLPQEGADDIRAAFLGRHLARGGGKGDRATRAHQPLETLSDVLGREDRALIGTHADKFVAALVDMDHAGQDVRAFRRLEEPQVRPAVPGDGRIRRAKVNSQMHHNPRFRSSSAPPCQAAGRSCSQPQQARRWSRRSAFRHRQNHRR